MAVSFWSLAQPQTQRALKGDRFDENRVGLDHISFTVRSRGELDHAVRVLDACGAPHGEIVDLADFRIYVLMLRDPDNIQVELTAPYDQVA